MPYKNPHTPPPINLFSSLKALLSQNQLIGQLIKREVVGRYKGSIFGLAWSFLNPLLMLVIYTFVFSVVFKARWGDAEGGNRSQFALLVFVGMIVQGLFTEAVNRAPNLIISNANYVKKVIFPLEILPIISLGAAFFHAAVSWLVFLIALIVVGGHCYWTIIFIPLIFTPFLGLILGLTWMLASLGVYIRDVGQTIGMLTTILMFMSPIFYPVSALPLSLQGWMMLNPLTFIIEQSRSVAILGQLPNWYGMGAYSGISLLTLWLGYAWFQKTRRGFADVL